MLPSSKSDLRAEGLRRRRAFARSLDPATRASMEAELARASSCRICSARASSPPIIRCGTKSACWHRRRARPGPTLRPALVRASRRHLPLARGAGQRAEPLGRAAAARRRPRRWRRTWCWCRSSSPTGTAPASATARAITTARSPTCARAAAGDDDRPRAGRTSSSRSASGRSLGHAAGRDRNAGRMGAHARRTELAPGRGHGPDPRLDHPVVRRSSPASAGWITGAPCWAQTPSISSPASSGSFRCGRCCAGWRPAAGAGWRAE